MDAPGLVSLVISRFWVYWSRIFSSAVRGLTNGDQHWSKVCVFSIYGCLWARPTESLQIHVRLWNSVSALLLMKLRHDRYMWRSSTTAPRKLKQPNIFLTTPMLHCYNLLKPFKSANQISEEASITNETILAKVRTFSVSLLKSLPFGSSQLGCIQ